MDQIRSIERNQEIPYKGEIPVKYVRKYSWQKLHVIESRLFSSGAFCDLVWSDPEEVENFAVSPRGAGWLFGESVTQKFMEINNLKLICRAHQLVHEGKSYCLSEQILCNEVKYAIGI